MSSKPMGIMILAILQLLMAIVYLASGALIFMALGGDPLGNLLGAFFAFFPIVLGIIGLILFYGLWTGTGWAWLWTLLINILGILSGLMNYGSLFTDLVLLASFGLSVVIVIYLFVPGTRAHFQ